MSTPNLQHLGVRSTCAENLPATLTNSHVNGAIVAAHANPLFGGTSPTPTNRAGSCTVSSGWDPIESVQQEATKGDAQMQQLQNTVEGCNKATGSVQDALALADAANADILQRTAAAAKEAQEHAEGELASLQCVHRHMLAQLQEVEAVNAVLKREVEIAEAAKTSAQSDAHAQVAAAVGLKKEAVAAKQEVVAVHAEVKAAQVQYHAQYSWRLRINVLCGISNVLYERWVRHF